MPHIQWEYWNARKFSVSRYEVIFQSLNSDFFRKEFKAEPLKNFLVVPANGNHVLYYVLNEYKPFLERLYSGLTASVEQFKYFKKLFQHDQENFVKVCERIKSQDLEGASVKQLEQFYVEYMNAYIRFFTTTILVPFCLEPLLSRRANTEIETILESQGKINDFQVYFNAIFLPEKKNAIQRQREDLLLLIQDIKMKKFSEEKVNAELKRHAKEYEWIPCYDVPDESWKMEDFQKMLNEAMQGNWKKELEDFSGFEERHNRFVTTLKQLQCTEEQKTLFTVAHEMAFIKDERDDYRRRGSFAIQPFLIELGKRMGGLDLVEVAQLLSTEVLTYFRSGLCPSKKEVAQRNNGFVLVQKHWKSTIYLYTGDQAQAVLLSELAHIQRNEKEEVQGISASKGDTHGKVCLVITKRDLGKVNEGDILVTVTTHPDFVPAMRKCKAIVTDEGGLTSHAAIVSRELGIPCIVGTQQATGVFKHGSTVRVNANEGWVRKVDY